MSRNFELMQQLELVTPAEPRERFANDLPAPAPLIDELGFSAGSHRWAVDEAMGLVHRIFLPQTETSPRVVAFAGVDHGDGCTGIAASVAETLAGNGNGPVCLVEGNFRTPALSALFGIKNQNGLAECLLREGPVRSFARPLGNNSFWLLPCGNGATNWPNLISSDRIRPRLDELRKEFAFVIIDTPPLTRYSDAVAIGQIADGLILVLQAAGTRRESAQMVTASLRSARVPILGAVLNKRTFPIPEQIYRRL